MGYVSGYTLNGGRRPARSTHDFHRRPASRDSRHGRSSRNRQGAAAGAARAEARARRPAARAQGPGRLGRPRRDPRAPLRSARPHEPGRRARRHARAGLRLRGAGPAARGRARRHLHRGGQPQPGHARRPRRGARRAREGRRPGRGPDRPDPRARRVADRRPLRRATRRVWASWCRSTGASSWTSRSRRPTAAARRRARWSSWRSRAGPRPRAAPLGRVVEVLGPIDAPGVDTEIILRKYGIVDGHGDAALAEARRLGGAGPGARPRPGARTSGRGRP